MSRSDAVRPQGRTLYEFATAEGVFTGWYEPNAGLWLALYGQGVFLHTQVLRFRPVMLTPLQDDELCTLIAEQARQALEEFPTNTEGLNLSLPALVALRKRMTVLGYTMSLAEAKQAIYAAQKEAAG